MKISYLLNRTSQKLRHSVEDGFRLFTYGSRSHHIVNQIEIRVFGLRRSGNHAIINWIGRQVKGNTVFINHVKPQENPYRNQYENYLSHKGGQVQKKDWKYKDIDWWKREKEGRFSFKDCLIYSYEDQELERVASSLFERKHDMYLGKSEKRFDLIVMRDPFNLFASRFQTKPRDDGPNFSMLEVYSKRYSLPELWISYAKECLGETSFLPSEKVIVNYNEWFVNVGYRKQIAEKIGISFSDEGFSDVSEAGRGSSFDGSRYAGQAYKMDVMSRWRSYVDNPSYRSLLSTERLLLYSEKLFGHIPCTEILR